MRRGQRGGSAARRRSWLGLGLVLLGVALVLAVLESDVDGSSAETLDDAPTPPRHAAPVGDAVPGVDAVPRSPRDRLQVDDASTRPPGATPESTTSLTVVVALSDGPGVLRPAWEFRLTTSGAGDDEPRIVPLEASADEPTAVAASLLDVPAGRASWWIGTEGLVVACGSVTLGPDAGVLRLEETDLPSVSGRVVGPAGGLGGARLELKGVAPDITHRGLGLRGGAAPDGRFVFRGVPRDVLYDLEVRADGFAPHRSSAWGFGSDVHLVTEDLTLERRHVVEVDVRRATGEIADGALVVLSPASGGAGVRGQVEGGAATLVGVEAGSWVLQARDGDAVSAPRELRVEGQDPTRPPALQLMAGAFARGVVEDATGKAARGVHVRGRSGALDAVDVSGADGRFSLGPFPNGAEVDVTLAGSADVQRSTTAGGPELRVVVDDLSEWALRLQVTDASSGEPLAGAVRWTLRSEDLRISGTADPDGAGSAVLRHRGPAWRRAELLIETDTHVGGPLSLDESTWRSGLLQVALVRRSAVELQLLGPDGDVPATAFARLSWPAEGPRPGVPGAGWDVMPLDGRAAFVLVAPLGADGRLRLEDVGPGLSRRLSLLSPGCLPVTTWLEPGQPLPATVQMRPSDPCGSGSFR